MSEAQPTKPREPPRVSDKSDDKPGSKSKSKAAPDSKLELESTRRYPDGSTFNKMFGDTQFTGTVFAFDNKERYYRIQYNDRDEDELDKNELSALLAASNATNCKYRAKVAKKRKQTKRRNPPSPTADSQ